MKRQIISGLLSMAMLLSMLIVGVSAAGEDTLNACGPVGFKDPERITYTEAVSVTGGLGLFAGTTDGRFDPLGTVTRAQMATIIVKMVKGADFNADSYKGGANPFSDTADYQDGWAEGYINACAQMGIVKGYGDGTFQPANPVTAAEALTMVLNALKVDAGAGEWPATVMAKAGELKLAEDLGYAPAADKVLNREQLAVIVNEGVQYKPEGGEALIASVFGVKNINTEHKYGETHCEVCRAAKPGLLTRADLENAVVELGWDYFMKGVKLQYCSQELDKLGKFHGGHHRLDYDKAPEIGTSDSTIYAVCSDYCYKTYYEAIGHRLLGATDSLNCITYDMWRRTENQGVKEPISEDDVDYTIVRWKNSTNNALESVARAREVDKSPYFANFGDYHLTFANGYYPATKEEVEMQTAAVREFLMDWEKNLRPGDILCSHGHAMLYVGNGYILDCTSSPGGGKYDLENGLEVIEPNGSVHRLSTMDWLLSWIFNESKRDWFVAFRPSKGLVIDDGDGILANDLVIDGAASIPENTKSRMEFPAMEIDRTASVMPYNTLVSGQELTYSVKITNRTNDEKFIQYMTYGGAHYQPVDYKGLTVTETVPAGTQFVSATGDVKNDNGKLSWTVDVPAGQTVEVTYTVKVTAAQGESITNEGGFVADIPSNTLTHQVGGKKLGEQELAALAAIADTDIAQWREKFNISALAADLDFADRIYAKMDIDLNLPTLNDLVTNLFPWGPQPNKSTHLNYSDRADMDLFTVNNTPAAEYQKYRDMLVENYWGGYLFFVGEDKFGTSINELRAEYLEPGDILVYVTFSVNGEPLAADILVYAGLNSAGEPAVLELNGTTQKLVLHTGQAARDRIWNAFMPDVSLFFVLRPSQVLENLNVTSFDPAKEPVYGEEPVVTRPTELGTTTLPAASIKMLQTLSYKDLAASMKIKFAYNVYDKIGINGLDSIMKSASGSDITSCTAVVVACFTRDGGEEPNRIYKVRETYDTAAGKMFLQDFYSGTWLPDTGKIPTLDDLKPGDILVLGARGMNSKNTPTADELCVVYQGNGKFVMGGYEGYARTGAYGPVTVGYVYGELDFNGEKPVGEFNFGGSATAMGKVYRTVNDLTTTDEKYGYVKVDSFEHFFTHDPVTGGEWAYAFILRPTQGVYDICDVTYTPEAAN